MTTSVHIIASSRSDVAIVRASRRDVALAAEDGQHIDTEGGDTLVSGDLLPGGFEAAVRVEGWET